MLPEPQQSVPIEVESKFAAPANLDADQVAALAHLGGLPLHRRAPARLQTTYYDTSNDDLQTQRMALRLRDNGATWEATIKWAGQSDGSMHSRPELTVTLERRPEANHLLRHPQFAPHLRFLKGRKLQAIARTDIQRVCFDVGALQSPHAELAFDTVAIVRPIDGVVVDTFCEVELEACQAAASELDILATELASRLALAPSKESKLQRARRAIAAASA